jgi:nucleoid DNA-binding protein
MIKIDLARNIAETMNIHTKDAETFLTAFTDIVSDSLASGEPVRLSGFGVIGVRGVTYIEPHTAPIITITDS